MSEFDRDRIALVVAEPARGGAAGESVGTGYFLTGDLVLTARHVGERNWKFRIRAENGGSEEDRWSPAEPCWVGAGDVDAMLLRTQRRFGDWEVPDFPDVTDGAWRSAGYAKAAADEEHDNRKTLPLYGSFDVSLGQGPAELALQTEQIISEGSDSSWKGVSGAPVFATGSAGHDGLIGIITDATRVMRNSLTGLSVSRILSDINFRSVIAPSFLSWLPAMPWGLCLVLTSEGWKSDLTGKVADVLSGYRDEPQFMRLYGEPIEIPVLGAVESAENWMATVNALAQADYLIADVTSFEPAVMLLLGIRSVLRRGVTISVSADMPTVLASSVPFNVRETRVLPLSAPRFYERLHQAMVEGATNIGLDSNYLDLPAYQAVRMPRPERWAEDDENSVLILCSFGEAYSRFYAETFESFLSGKTRNKTLLRMMDMTSPRLVGQALYEQIRWSSRCLVDWTEWRPNVFFELGVRLACSQHDPLCILQRGDQYGPGGDGRQQIQQYKLLQRLLAPVMYDKANPRKELSGALEPWSGRTLPASIRTMPQDSLPPAATFKTAQASFVWRRDRMLTEPHLEQREAAEQIFGKDPERKPERLVLFADNELFDKELRAAVQEKWIAAWLYLSHLSAADDAPERVKVELVTFARLVEYALRKSGNERHKKLREEIRDFLKAERSRRRGGE